MLEVVVIHSGVLGIGLVVDALGIRLQVVEVVDAVGTIDGVGLHECRVLEVTLLGPERTGVESRTRRTAHHHTRVYGVFAAVVALVEIACQRVAHARELQGLREDGERAVLCNLVGQQQAARRDDVVQDVYDTIRDGVVVVHHACVLIDIVYQCVVVGNIRVAGEDDVAIVHVQLRQGTFVDVGGEERTFLDDVRACDGVAGGGGNTVDVAIAHALQIALDAFVVRGKEGVLAIGGEHREVRCAFQDADELAEILGVLLQEFCSSELRRRVVVLGDVVVVDARRQQPAHSSNEHHEPYQQLLYLFHVCCNHSATYRTFANHIGF